jgi:prepilin signal peptidase PulO-like enzyme (type II secretory pathway)
MLKAKCKFCDAKISLQYLIVEILVAIIALPFINQASQMLSNAILHWTDFLVVLLYFVFVMSVISVTVALAFIDQRFKILPHKLSYAIIIFAIIFSAIFQPIFYQAESLFMVPSSLAALATVLKEIGLVFFVLDFGVNVINVICFRQKASLHLAPALGLGIKFLQSRVIMTYLIWLTVIFVSLPIIHDLIWVFIGFLYLALEIVPHFLPSKKSSELSVEENEERTILGGGDISMLAMIAAVLGAQKTFFVFMASAYICLLFILFAFAYRYISSANQRTTGDFDYKAYLKQSYPLGAALAISFLAAMMIFG